MSARAPGASIAEASPVGRARAAVLGRAEAGEFVAAAFARAIETRTLLLARFPTPRAPLEAPLARLRKGSATLFRAPDHRRGTAFATFGEAASIALEGEARFEALEVWSNALFASLKVVAHPDAPRVSPRIVGGLAFAPGGHAGPWEAFGDGRFALPRFTYAHLDTHGGESAYLEVALDGRDGWSGRSRWIEAELDAIYEAFSEDRTRPEESRPRSLRRGAEGLTGWEEAIAAIHRAFDQGALEKVVAARMTEVHADYEIEPWEVLERLGARYPETWRYGIRVGSSTLVAASPELLFRKTGIRVETHALAGSAPPGEGLALLESAKDRREHRFVVRHLLERLAPLASELSPESPDATPELLELPNVVHLHTPIRAELSEDLHPARLAARLHPTPAVAGTPTEAAEAWIAARERGRGWYAGLVGWIDGGGDAELSVALRCGLIRGASAWLFAGAGIVRGSQAASEWRETDLKLRPLLDALGASP